MKNITIEQLTGNVPKQLNKLMISQAVEWQCIQWRVFNGKIPLDTEKIIEYIENHWK
jgi:hypothetical protein